MNRTHFLWGTLASALLATGCAAEVGDPSDLPAAQAPAEDSSTDTRYGQQRKEDAESCPFGRVENLAGAWVGIPSACVATTHPDPDPGERRVQSPGPPRPDDPMLTAGPRLRSAPEQGH
jgi:hypothetical protein